jgi:hypothetical protein
MTILSIRAVLLVVDPGASAGGPPKNGIQPQGIDFDQGAPPISCLMSGG